jgi:monoamine oxidase
LFVTTSAHQTRAVRPGTRVVVIGAGAAGLKAARDLKAAGCVVTVLEARARIGGRIQTDHTRFGAPVELGAQFIHGRSKSNGAQNPIWTLAQSQRWASVPYAGSGQTYRNGVALTDAEEDVFNTLGEGFLDWVIEVQKDVIWGNLSYSLEHALKAYAAARRLTAQQVIDLRAYLAAEIEGDLAADTTQISVQTIDEDDEYGVGGDVQLTGGYDQLPNLLAAGLDIRLNCIVKSVTHSASPVKVVTSLGTFLAEHVLVTVPLGVLKKGAITFSPVLPTAKRTAISRMGVGAFNKVILQFPTRFWPNGNWFVNIAGADPYGISFSSLEAAAPGKNLLVGWQFGSLAVKREAMTDAALINVVMTELRAMFKSAVVPAPTASAITRWTADPYSRGAYSYPRIGSPRTDITALAAPVGKRLYFAGEATSMDFPSTVHGAYLSGEREARNIIAAASA